MSSGGDPAARSPGDVLTGRWEASEATIPLGAVRAILFDLCDVLFDDTAWGRWLHRLIARMGCSIGYDQFWAMWQCEFQHQLVFDGRNPEDVLRALLTRFGLSRGQIDEVCAASLARRSHAEGTLRPLPGVKAGLAQLDAAGWTLGVLGNVAWTSAEVQQCVERLGLASYIDVSLSARELAVSRPAISPYVQASQAMNAAPEQTVFVSANRYELQQASRFGLPTVSVQVAAVVGQRGSIEQLGDLVRMLRVSKNHSRAG